MYIFVFLRSRIVLREAQEEKMSKDWAKRSFEDPDNLYGGGGGGDGDGNRPRKTFSFFIPDPAKAGKTVTKRIMFLDTVPFAFWEHNFFKITGKSQDKCICLGKNGLDERGCPLCEKEFWPSYSGYFTIIDMGEVTGYSGGKAKLEGYVGKKDRLWQFDKKILCAKRGGDDKPGILKKLERNREKHGGDLTGTVWDVSRSGKLVESCGDDWDYVERVRPEDFEAYLVKAGADASKLDLVPVDYYEEFIPRSFEDLCRVVGISAGKGQGGGDARAEGAGYDGPEDDPPF